MSIVGECIPFTGRSRCGKGLRYGYRRYKGQMMTAHRAAFIEAGGLIPSGYVVDHLCNEPLCVNVDHLEAVTPAENRRRQAERQTHCRRGGHPLVDAYISPAGERCCRACRVDATRRYRARKRAAA